MPVRKKIRVAFAFPMGLAFIERLQKGILDYARARGGWTFTRLPEMLSPSIDWLRHWPGDGAFVLLTSAADARVARSLPMPVVNLAGHFADPGVPSVTVDHEAIGRLAAEHLVERRFTRFAYYGIRGKWFSIQRRDGFGKAVRAAGGELDFLEATALVGPGTRWTDHQKELTGWLRRLRTPVGILASSDHRAVMIYEACTTLKLRIPEDVAIIGVDNDPVACEFCQPPLSSVSRNDVRVGYEAAALLDLLIRGGAPPKRPILVPPDAVVPRRSTETWAIEDVQVAAAVKFIHEHLTENFGVERLLKESALSRRRLEHRFRETLGRSPYVFINELRVAQARRLLAAPEGRDLADIAAECGFREARRLRLVFQKLTGMKPSRYRQAMRAKHERAD